MATVRGRSCVHRFPVAFRLPPLASWPSCSRHGYPRSSRSAYRWLV